MANSGTIQLANSASAGLVPSVGSCVPVQNGPGTGVVTFQITGTYVMTLHVGASLDGATLVQLLDSSVTNVNTGATGISGPGLYTVPVPAGTIFVYASAYTSGAAIVTLVSGLGSGTPGASGGGDAVVVTNTVAVSNPSLPGKPTLTPNAQGVVNLTVKASAGTIFAWGVYNRNASVRYAFIFDSATATGTVLGVFPIYPSGFTEIGSEWYSNAGVATTTGFTIGISTSNTSYIAATAADHDINAVAN